MISNFLFTFLLSAAFKFVFDLSSRVILTLNFYGSFGKVISHYTTSTINFSVLVSCELWCYRCVSSEPGCEEFFIDWRIHSAITCPRTDDKCVKVIQRKGVDSFITRDCLSNLESQKNDIPADRYDGCRKAAEQPKRAVYVENHIPQLEIKSDDEPYDDVTYCFCEFDQWCNLGSTFKSSKLTLLSVVCIVYLFMMYVKC